MYFSFISRPCYATLLSPSACLSSVTYVLWLNSAS